MPKFEMEHKLAPETEEWVARREARLEELLEEITLVVKQVAVISAGGGLLVGLSVGYIIGKTT